MGIHSCSLFLFYFPFSQIVPFNGKVFKDLKILQLHKIFTGFQSQINNTTFIQRNPASITLPFPDKIAFFFLCLTLHLLFVFKYKQVMCMCTHKHVCMCPKQYQTLPTLSPWVISPKSTSFILLWGELSILARRDGPQHFVQLRNTPSYGYALVYSSTFLMIDLWFLSSLYH